jgi:hypothetical protein
VQLVAQLGARTDEPITMHQALLELGVDLWRWRPAGGLEPRTEFGQRLRINGIGLGAFVALALAKSCAWAGLMTATAKEAATRLLAKRIQ